MHEGQAPSKALFDDDLLRVIDLDYLQRVYFHITLTLGVRKPFNFYTRAASRYCPGVATAK